MSYSHTINKKVEKHIERLKPLLFEVIFSSIEYDDKKIHDARCRTVVTLLADDLRPIVYGIMYKRRSLVHKAIVTFMRKHRIPFNSHNSHDVPMMRAMHGGGMGYELMLLLIILLLLFSNMYHYMSSEIKTTAITEIGKYVIEDSIEGASVSLANNYVKRPIHTMRTNKAPFNALTSFLASLYNSNNGLNIMDPRIIASFLENQSGGVKHMATIHGVAIIVVFVRVIVLVHSAIIGRRSTQHSRDTIIEDLQEGEYILNQHIMQNAALMKPLDDVYDEVMANVDKFDTVYNIMSADDD